MIGRPYPGDTYNPRYWLRKKAGHRYSQSPWQPKKTAIRQMREGNNYVIPLSTYVPGPNPYIEKRRYTAEEYGRNSFDIDWRYLGTRGS